MKRIDSLYDNRLVKKPWGYEYVVYRHKNNLSVTLLKINYNQSLHYIVTLKKKVGLFF